MKKSIKRMALPLLTTSLFLVSPISAILDAQLGLGYTNRDISDNGSTNGLRVLDKSWKGMAINASAHLNFSVPLVMSLGVGPYLTYAPDMNYTGGTATGYTYTNTQLSIGAEVQAKLLVIPAVSPYAKFGYGSESLKSVATQSGISAELSYSGTGYRVLFGLEIPVAPVIALFAEGGITGATYDGTVIGISGLKAKTSGSLFNFGISLGF